MSVKPDPQTPKLPTGSYCVSFTYFSNTFSICPTFS
jgi:hypothetical protein